MIDRIKLEKLINEEIIDYDTTIKYFNKEEDVFEMWHLLAKSLPATKDKIMFAYEQSDKGNLSFQISKLAGALAYIAAPRIEFQVKCIDLRLGDDDFNINEHYNALISEIDIFMEAFEDIFPKQKQVISRESL